MRGKAVYERSNDVLSALLISCLIALSPALAYAEPAGQPVAAAALGSRVHTFAHPDSRERLLNFYTSVLGAQAMTLSSAPDIVAFAFADKSALSVEFTADALTEEQARRGTYVELRVRDTQDLQARILAAGVRQLTVPGSPHFYFQAPGGQVMRVVPSKASDR